jgi:hypothetical protein
MTHKTLRPDLPKLILPKTPCSSVFTWCKKSSRAWKRLLRPDPTSTRLPCKRRKKWGGWPWVWTNTAVGARDFAESLEAAEVAEDEVFFFGGVSLWK